MFKHFNPWRHPTLQEVKKHDTEATEMGLHEAEMALERALANVNMLRNRLNRLKGEQNAN